MHRPVIMLLPRPNPRKVSSLAALGILASKQYKVLLETIYFLDADINLVKVMHSYDVRGKQTEIPRVEAAYIVFGDEAKERAKALGVRFFYLPELKSLAPKKELVKARNFVYNYQEER